MPQANARKTKGNAAGRRASADLTSTWRLRRGVDAGELQVNGHDQTGQRVPWQMGRVLTNTHRFNWRWPREAEFQQNHHDMHVSTISLESIAG
ncbi:MAG: hypothetical protein EBZ60_06050 [Betaproteobacteria bacterium]|nr:hypothetical protein [Betaproteobacteria bacterium]